MYAADASEQWGRLVEDHMELVRRIAFHLLGRLPPAVQVEDLIQAGAIGLLDAAKHYDSSHGASFETYAGLRIRGAMLDELRRSDWSPRSANRLARQIGQAMQSVEASTGSAAGSADVAAALGVDVDTYHDMVRRASQARVFSLEEIYGPDDGADVLSGGDDPAGEVLRGDFGESLQAAIAGLPERERMVMSLYYDDELTLKEIGAVLGVTESRVCQLHGQALVRLRSKLTEWEYDEISV